MICIAIYTENLQTASLLKDYIQDFLIEQRITAKVSVLEDPCKFITVPGSYDLYIMDMDNNTDVIELGQKMKEIDKGSKYLYICQNPAEAYKAAEIFADYYLNSPVNKEKLERVLSDVLKSIKKNSIVIQRSSGERRVRIDKINYINIVKRYLCYHLNDGNMFDGQTLRTSFEKAIENLLDHENFVFVSPSLLINVEEIKILNSDNLVFENDEVLYFPKRAHDDIRECWVNHSKIIE